MDQKEILDWLQALAPAGVVFFFVKKWGRDVETALKEFAVELAKVKETLHDMAVKNEHDHGEVKAEMKAGIAALNVRVDSLHQSLTREQHRT